jgi:hypothetical protein
MALQSAVTLSELQARFSFTVRKVRDFWHFFMVLAFL